MKVKFLRTQADNMNEINHVCQYTKLDSIAMYNLYSETPFLNNFIPKFGITKQITKRVIPSGLVVGFYDINDNLICWEMYEDFAIKLEFLLNTGTVDFNYGYIFGTHNPLGRVAGMMSATTMQGYQIWIQTIHKNESKD